jgi:hypothetical protein
LLAVALAAVATGCNDPAAPVPTISSTAPPAPAGASRVEARQPLSLATAPRPVPMPASVATPNGGRRIDLRGTNAHVITLDRQPDGTFKRSCNYAPETVKGRSAP